MTTLTPTSRNTHRNSSRNSIALNKLMRDSNLRQLPWVLYQYCATCMHIEALVVSATSEKAVRVIPALKKLAAQLRIPVIIVEHTHRDEDHIHPAFVHSYEPSTDELIKVSSVGDWEGVAKHLNSLHRDHSYESECPSSTSLLVDGTWKTTDSDSSVSNVARRIPGVRHIDIDASVYCPRCYQTQILIEASSTGMKGTSYEDQVKAVRMTRRVAKAVKCETLLLLHHPQDENHREPVMTSSWTYDGETAPENVTTWGNVRRYMKSRMQSHQRDCSAQVVS